MTGSLTPRTYPSGTITVRCEQCGREGRYRRARLRGGVKGSYNSAMTKLEKPLGLCTVCGRPVPEMQTIGGPCRFKSSDGKTCEGSFIRTLSGDLRECLICGATGLDGSTQCSNCHGVGYFYSGGPG